MKKIAVVLAGGRGSRMNSDIPKQYLMLKDRPVLYYALKAFQDSNIDSIVLAAGENDLEMCRTQIVEKYGINKTDNLVTAWDMLSPGTPGECTMCEKDGRTVYDIPSVFAELGMYMAKRCEG